MSQGNELDLKFLERSLQQQESARQTFFRDLKIATILLLAFQFVIFFRFIDLNDQVLRLDAQIAPLLNDQEALSEVQAQLASLQDTLQIGEKQLTERLKEAPSTLREQILDLENYITNLRAEPSADSPLATPPTPSPILQGPPTTESSLPPVFLAGLSDTDMNILKTANPQERAFNDLLKHIVDEGIVQPMFVALNASKDELLEKPFAEKKSQLLTTLESRRSALERYGLSTSDIEETVNRVHTNLQALQFTAPTSDRWWRTFGDKQTVFGARVIDTEEVVGQISQELRKPEQDLASFGLQLTTLIQEGEAKKEELDSQMQKLQSNYSEVQSLLQIYAKPLPVVALEVKDAVIYYPLILAAAFAYFVWRYVLLHQRARSLAAAYGDLGLSDEVMQVYFADFPGFTKVTQPQKTLGGYPLATGLVVVLWAAPGVFAAVSLYRILTSPGLMSAAPLFLYAIAAALFIVSYLTLALRVLRPIQERQS